MTLPHSDALVLFGATGDLADKKIFPALYELVKGGALDVPVVGVASRKWSLAQLRERVKDSVERSGGIDDSAALNRLLSLLELRQRRLQRPGHLRGDQEGAGRRRAPRALPRDPAGFVRDGDQGAGRPRSRRGMRG